MGDYALFAPYTGHSYFIVNMRERAYTAVTTNDDIRVRITHSAINTRGEIAAFSSCIFAGDKLLVISPTFTQPQIIDDNFTGREGFRTDLFWSADGQLLAAINNRNEAVIYNARTLQVMHIIPLMTPVGISFTPGNQYLLALSANGTLYKYALFYAMQAQQLKVHDSVAATTGRGMGMRMFEFLDIDGMDSLILTGAGFGNSYVIDIEEFAFRAAIPSLGAYNARHHIFVQYESWGIQIRHLYSASELVEMALNVVGNAQ